MRIHVHGLCWNESMLLPYWLRHYQTFCEKIVVHDNISTDGSPDIARNMGAEVRTWDSGDQIRDDIYLSMKNAIANKAKSECDWLIIADLDEFVWFKNVQDTLQVAEQQGHNVIIPKGYSLASTEIPTHDGLLWEMEGFNRAADSEAKPCVIRPRGFETTIQYNYGGHELLNAGQSRMQAADDVRFIHAKYVGGEDVLVGRYVEYQKRLSAKNKAHRWGYHYLQGQEATRAEHKSIIANSKPIF